MLLNDVRQLLPIGSVVKLKGAEKFLMIFGRKRYYAIKIVPNAVIVKKCLKKHL